MAVQVSFGNHRDGVYEGCASRNITTLNVTAGTNLTMYCNVSLTSSLKCTTTGANSAHVPQQVVNNCNSALGATVSASTTTQIAGEYFT